MKNATKVRERIILSNITTLYFLYEVTESIVRELLFIVKYKVCTLMTLSESTEL